jgi:hypothetical protein
MQKTVHSVAQVAFFFFVGFGLLHISSAFLVAQEVGGPLAQFLFKALDLPFLLAALVYGTAQLSLKLESLTGNLEWPLVICSLGSLVLFLAALSINFLFLDA